MNILAPFARLLGLRTDAAPAIEAREDAPEIPGYSSAGVVNNLSGIGAARDSGQAARPNIQRLLLTDQELEALYRDTVYGRLCELMPDYATQQGITVSDGTPLHDPLAARIDELELLPRLAKADALARAYGRAALWPVAEDDAASLLEPLDPAKVSAVHAVHVLNYRDFSVVAWDNDIRSQRMGRPRIYQVSPPQTGRSYTVHASHLGVLLGDPLTPGMSFTSREGAPLAWRWWDAIRDQASTSAAAARAAQELSVGVFKIGTAREKMTGDQGAAFALRMQLLALYKSVAQAIVLTGPDEEYRRESIPAQGFDSLSATARQILSLVTGFPEQLLYGTAPAGLSTDGDSWWRNWTNTVNAYQIRRYAAPMRWLCRILYAEAGGEPDEWKLEFNPLGALDSKSRAEIRAMTTAADASEIQMGVLFPNEVRARYATGRYDFELQPLTDAPDAEESSGADLDKAGQALAALLSPAPTATDSRADGPLALCLLADLDPEGKAVYAAALEAVRAILPDIEVEPRPHVTLLYLGDQPQADLLLNSYDRARAVLAEASPVALQAGRVQVFDAPPGQPSPIVIEYRSRALTALAAALLRACAPAVTAAQHDRYRAHVALGYANPTDEQLAALEGITAPGRHLITHAVMTQGDREIGRPMKLGS